MPGHWCELDRIGVWRIGPADGGAAENGADSSAASGETGTASLLSPSETRLAAETSSTAAEPGQSYAWLHGDLTMPLLWTVLGLLLAESWLFHRKAVY